MVPIVSAVGALSCFSPSDLAACMHVKADMCQHAQRMISMAALMLAAPQDPMHPSWYAALPVAGCCTDARPCISLHRPSIAC